jgi:uncharacterized protein (DUF983 family)
MRIMAEIVFPLWRSISRGLSHHCPSCGAGRLYGRYLKIEPECAACGHRLAAYPADDGPAYLTILLVGHLIIAPLLVFPVVWETSPIIALPILLGGLTAVVLAGLPRIKGGWVGLMYALQVTDAKARLHTSDAAD